MSRRSALRTAVAVALFSLALGAGFLASSQLGQRWMRDEAELQLGLLLDADVHIEQIRLRLRYGIEVHGEQIRVEYPPGESSALSATRAIATFDTPSLLVGRLRIARLEIDGLQIELRRDRSGVWSPPWFRSSADRAALHASDPSFESRLGSLKGGISAVHFLLRDQKLAGQIELRDASVRLVDARARAQATSPAVLRLEAIGARLDRSWLRGESDFELEATWLGPQGHRAPLEMAGRWRHDASDLHLTIAFTGIELASLRPYIVSPARRGDIAGRVSGVVAIVTPETDRGLIEVDWSFDEFESEMPLGDSQIKLSSLLDTLQARLSLEPRRLRLESALLKGRAIELRLRGNAARPLGPRSLVTLRADLSRTDLSDLRRMATGLPQAEAESFLAMLDQMQSGHIPQVGVRGGARLDEWIQLFQGDRTALPDTLRLFADIDDVTFGTSPTDTMSDVSAHVTFSGDTFEIHGLRATYNGEALPRVDFAVRGVSAVLGPTDQDQQITRRARPLPGLGTLWDIVRGDPEDAASTPPSPILVNLDELQHPALRWPIRNAEIQIDPTERNLHLTIARGIWNGKPILGEAILDRGPDPELRIELVVADETPAPEWSEAPQAVEAAPAPEAAQPADVRDAPWASGRFASAGIHADPLVFEYVEGGFAVRGQTLALSQVEASLVEGGVLTGSGSFALDREGEVAVGVDLDAAGANADHVAQLFGLAPGFATGRADVRGQLAGTLRPDTALIDELVGMIVIEAHDGELQQRVPLLAAVSHAIEGWSPATASETLQYEQIETRIDFQRGWLSTERFALEGPLRIVASGSIDLREEPAPVEATIGLFLLRQADRLLGDIPLVNLLVPGSDRGLIGVYFKASGTLADPEVRTMTMKSIAEGVPLPEVLRQPFDALQKLFSRSSSSGRNGRGGEE